MNERKDSLAWPEGFAVRPATLGDAEAVADLVNEYFVDRIGLPLADPEQLRARWQSRDDLESNTLVVLSLDGTPVGYAALRDEEPHTRPDASVTVHPGYWGQGIEIALNRWVEKRARQSASQAPEGVRVALVQRAPGMDTANQRLLEGQGYQPVRYSFYMAIQMEEPPPEPEFPSELDIRTFAHEGDLKALVLATEDVLKDHWGYVERPFQVAYEEWKRYGDDNPDHDPSLWFLALDTEGIAGMALFDPGTAWDPQMGWCLMLGVRRRWRKLGVGLALLLHGFGEMYRRGTHKVGLMVDAQNLTGATRLYEKAGMHIEGQWAEFEKELRPGRDAVVRSLEG